jgi:hypothetical protein
MPGQKAIADAGEHIGDWINHSHQSLLLATMEISSRLPGGLNDPRQLASQGLLPEANAAELKLADVASRAAADLAAVPDANRVLPPTFPDNDGLLGHNSVASSKGHAQEL